MGAMDITLRTYAPLEVLLSKLQMIEAFRRLAPYAQALSRSVATEAYTSSATTSAAYRRGEKRARAGARRRGPSTAPRGTKAQTRTQP
jgi:hypothetical protein